MAARDSYRGDEPAPARGAAAPSWREEVMGASGLNVLAGLWLIIAPFVLDYSGGDPIWNDVISGGIIALLALSRVFGLQREAALSWLNALVGAWLVASAFWLDNTASAGWNDVLLGVVVIGLAVWSAGAGESARGSGAATAPPPPQGPRRSSRRGV